MSISCTGNHKAELLQRNSATVEELIKVLQKSDLVKLSQELLNKEVLSKEIVKKFGSLDLENLDHGVRSRYLVHLIGKAMATKEGSCAKVVDIMSELGEDVRKIYLKWIEECQASSTAISKCPEDAYLLEKNLPFLLDALADLASKWREICAALQLPATILDECETNGSTDSERLEKGLHAWITGHHETTLPANLNNLKSALKTNEMDSDKIMKDLTECLIQKEEKQDKSENQQKDGNLEISWQSKERVVNEGKSTLLEVRVADQVGSTVTFQWLKDGQELADSEHYLGTTNSLLHITAHQKAPGNYNCRVSNGRGEIYSQQIFLTVISSLRDKDLLELYTLLEEVQMNKWPSASSCTFSNLTLASHNTGKNLQAKESIIKDTFGKVQTGSLILVKGRSGAGKTMLAYKLTTDWSKGKLLNQIKNLFLITTAMLSTLMKCQHLSDILKIFYKEQTKQNVLLGEIERSFGKGFCFIIDGLNQPPQADSNSIIHNMLFKKYLPEAVVIVMSSSIDALLFPPSAKSMIPMELANFTHVEIFQCIDNFPFHEPNEASDEEEVDPLALIEYIHADSTILYICTVPVHTSMACFIHKNSTCHLSTLTSLYNQFIQIHFLDQPESRGHDAQSSRDLKKKSQVFFQNICKIALKMTVDNQRAFSKTEVQLPSPEFLDNFTFQTSFICIDHLSERLGLVKTCTFLHQTLQKFLAAFHISQLEAKDQEAIIRQNVHKPFMRPVWQFLCGLTNVNKLSATHLENLLPTSGLFEMHCAFESQQANICDRVVDASEDGCIDLSGNILSPYDLSAMYLVITKASLPIKAICLNNCSLGDRYLIEVISQVSDDKLFSLEKMHLSNNGIGSLGATALADRLKHLPRNDRTAANVTSESNGIRLQELDLSHNSLGSDGAISLVFGLQQIMMNLQELNLSNNGLESRGVMAVLNDMIKIRNLKNLNLSHNHIDSETALIIVRGFLRDRHALQVLNLEEDDTPDNVSDIKEEILEHRSRLEVRLSPSVTLRASLRSNQACCNVS